VTDCRKAILTRLGIMTTEDNLKRIDAIVQAHIDAAAVVWKDLPIEEQVVLQGKARDYAIEAAYSDPNASDATIQQRLGDPRELGLRLWRGGLKNDKPAGFPTAGVATCVTATACVFGAFLACSHSYRGAIAPQFAVILLGAPFIGFCTGMVSPKRAITITGTVLGSIIVAATLYSLTLSGNFVLLHPVTSAPILDRIADRTFITVAPVVLNLIPGCLWAWIGSRIRTSIDRANASRRGQ
jgi:hypothetical protein